MGDEELFYPIPKYPDVKNYRRKFGKYKVREYRKGHWQVVFTHNKKQTTLQKDEAGKPLTSWGRAAFLAHKLELDGYDPRTFHKDKEFQFDTAIQTWISLSECCDESLYERKRITNKILIPYFQKMDIREIKQIHLLSFLKSLKEKGFKSAYQDNILKQLKLFLRFNKDSFTKLPEFPKIKVQSPMVKHLTPDQQDKVFVKIPQGHQRIFWFMRVYPVRPEEAAGLRWTDVFPDVDIPFFVIRNVVTRRGVFKEHTKTNKVRPYPILPELAWIFKNDGKNDFVFTRQNGKPHSSGSLYAIWKDANKKVDVPKVSLYGAMKHSRGWDLIDQGFSMEDVSLLMGHTTSKHTRRYAGQSLKRMTEILKGSVHSPLLDGKSPKLLELKTKLDNLPSSRV